MKIIAKLPKALLLISLLCVTIALDFIMYAFLGACPACSSIGQFLSSPAAVSAPFIASLAALFSLTEKRK